MKAIDLLNKIASKEELPLKIKLEQGVFTLREDCGGNKWYGREYDHKDIFETINQNLEYVLLEEIELIEEEKKIELPEQIIENDMPTLTIRNLASRYNKLIDYLKNKEEEKER